MPLSIIILAIVGIVIFIFFIVPLLLNFTGNTLELALRNLFLAPVMLGKGIIRQDKSLIICGLKGLIFSVVVLAIFVGAYLLILRLMDSNMA